MYNSMIYIRRISDANYWLFQSTAYLFCLSLIGFVFLLGVLVCGGITIFTKRRTAVLLSRFATSIAFKYYLNICGYFGLLKLDLSALDSLNDKKSLVIAANHPSLIDVILIVSRLKNCVCIAKNSLITHPILGVSARANDYISNHEISHMLKKSIATIASGTHILIFPEGTRTKLTQTQTINTLGGTAHIIAKRSNAHIQLVYIQTNSNFLGANWFFLKRPNFPIVYTARLGECLASNEALSEGLKRMTQAFEHNLSPYKNV